MKKLCTLCALIALGTASATVAASEPQILTAQELDTVAAGTGPTADVLAQAFATGDLGFSNTATTALVYDSTGLNGNPFTVGYVAAGAGVAAATAVGPGAATGTGVLTLTSVPGTNVLTISINQHTQAGASEISASATIQFGNFSNLLGPL